ncbi:Rieske (2Fe-2S) protein [Spongiibacter taiwanensis]|uniref:Rieske (2Fe-2S) protein n=1 Tax=Spongiibacter taiwanensis TaxID=1748242 RepID=UPI002035383E|nr:Rieske (2Fe-2S) protein [Spongiibacter taiwanensis]USA43020.1 Rieske (2Fe-2S) protein [Spongiibacter taiwanensis]
MMKIKVANVDDIPEGSFIRGEGDAKKVLLTRVNGQIAAIENRCPHLGLPLAKGKICEGAVTCPFHGSSFDLLSGQSTAWTTNFFGIPLPLWAQKLVAFGKPPQTVKTFPVECEEGSVFVKL